VFIKKKKICRDMLVDDKILFIAENFDYVEPS
jgi:hypothetical protein